MTEMLVIYVKNRVWILGSGWTRHEVAAPGRPECQVQPRHKRRALFLLYHYNHYILLFWKAVPGCSPGLASQALLRHNSSKDAPGYGMTQTQ